MLPLIEQHLLEIQSLCRKYDVKRLDLFGSAARGDFDPAKSDLDFFVEFTAYDTPRIADQWFGIQEDLKRLLGREVDLTTPSTVTNPYFWKVANKHRVTLYAG